MNQSIVPRKPLLVEIFRPVFLQTMFNEKLLEFPTHGVAWKKKDGNLRCPPWKNREVPRGKSLGESTWTIMSSDVLTSKVQQVPLCWVQTLVAGPFFFRMETMGGRDVDSWFLGSFKMFYCKHLVSWFPAWGDDPIHVFILFFYIYVYIHVIYKNLCNHLDHVDMHFVTQFKGPSVDAGRR